MRALLVVAPLQRLSLGGVRSQIRTGLSLISGTLQGIFANWGLISPNASAFVVKPGALRNGAPFKDWALPPALTQVRAKLKQHADGDRQFVKVLGAVLDHGLAAVERACAEALEAGLASGDVILSVLARRRQPTTPPSIITPDALHLKIEPAADCGRYDSIRKIA